MQTYDELTGHFNKTRLREAVDQIIAANQRTGSPAAFLSIGIDNMTMINDLFGYEAADTVLIEIGHRLDSCLRVSDLIGRLGGDRFGTALQHCPEEHISAAAEKILAAVSATPVATARGPVYATVSIGSASFPDQGQTSYDVMTRAESALAEAKRAGRDCHNHYRMTEEQRERQRRSLSISEQVQRRCAKSASCLPTSRWSSPTTGEVDHYECLLRMRTPDGRIIAASEFVPVIEQLGFIRLIDRYVLEKAIAELAAHPEVRLGFNISGLTAADRPWLRALVSAGAQPARDRLPPRRRDHRNRGAVRYRGIGAVRRALRDAGCRVALDDFGAGFTSLRHLQAWPSTPSRSTARSSAISPAAPRTRFSCATCSALRRGSASTPWPNASRPPRRRRSCGARASALCRATISATRHSIGHGLLPRRPPRSRPPIAPNSPPTELAIS